MLNGIENGGNTFPRIRKRSSINLSVRVSDSCDSCSVSDMRTKASKCQMHSLTSPFFPTKLSFPAGFQLLRLHTFAESQMSTRTTLGRSNMGDSCQAASHKAAATHPSWTSDFFLILVIKKINTPQTWTGSSPPSPGSRWGASILNITSYLRSTYKYKNTIHHSRLTLAVS